MLTKSLDDLVYEIALKRPDIFALGCASWSTRFPIAGQLEVTSACFQACKGCDSWRDHISGTMRDEWSLQEAIALSDALNLMVPFKHLSLTGGDPQAWPPLTKFLERGRKFTVQLNTALCKDPPIELWQKRVHDLRVSLDATTEETYKIIRGNAHPDATNTCVYEKGQITTPDEVIRRAWDLKHPNLTFNITVYKENFKEVPELLSLLAAWPEERLRKVHVMRGIGERGLKDPSFWPSLVEVARGVLPKRTNLESVEDPNEVRNLLAEKNVTFSDVRCWSGRVSFHIKANGDVYPCCLVGGEALPIQQGYRVMNLRASGDVQAAVEAMVDLADARFHYHGAKTPCRSVCQWKQFAVNCCGEWAARQKYAMP